MLHVELMLVHEELVLDHGMLLLEHGMLLLERGVLLLEHGMLSIREQPLDVGRELLEHWLLLLLASLDGPDAQNRSLRQFSADSPWASTATANKQRLPMGRMGGCGWLLVVVRRMGPLPCWRC